MNRSIRRSLSTVALILLYGFAMTPAEASASGCEPIAAARQKALGSSVSVIGTVTVPSGAFDTGFAIQQAGHGIYVLDAAGASRRAGDVVRVTGTLVDTSGLLSIQPTSVALLSDGSPVRAHQSATGAVGEATEGRLLHLRGTMLSPLVDDSPFGFKIDIDDGSGPIQIFLYPGTGISTEGLIPGAKIDTSCFSNQFEATYECDPPSPASFQVE